MCVDIDKSEHAMSRLQDALLEYEQKLLREQNKIMNLEKEISSLGISGLHQARAVHAY